MFSTLVLELTEMHCHYDVVALLCWLSFPEIAFGEPDLWAVSTDPHVVLVWEPSPNVLMAVSIP